MKAKNAFTRSPLNYFLQAYHGKQRATNQHLIGHGALGNMVALFTQAGWLVFLLLKYEEIALPRTDQAFGCDSIL